MLMEAMEAVYLQLILWLSNCFALVHFIAYPKGATFVFFSRLSRENSLKEKNVAFKIPALLIWFSINH